MVGGVGAVRRPTTRVTSVVHLSARVCFKDIGCMHRQMSSDVHSDAHPEKERQEKSVGNNEEGLGE